MTAWAAPSPCPPPFLASQTFLEAAAQLHEGGATWSTNPTRHVGPPSDIEFIRFPIVDGLVGVDSGVAQLVSDLVDRVNAGRLLYVHCMGGHGYAAAWGLRQVCPAPCVCARASSMRDCTRVTCARVGTRASACATSCAHGGLQASRHGVQPAP